MTGQDRIIFANRTMKKVLLLLVLLLCVLLCGVVADTYEKGRKRAQRAEETSNVDSSDTSCGSTRGEGGLLLTATVKVHNLHLIV